MNVQWRGQSAWELEQGQWGLTGQDVGDPGLFRGSVASFPPDSPPPAEFIGKEQLPSLCE